MAIDVSTPKLDTVTFEDEDKVVPSGTLGTELDPLPTDLQTEQAGYNDSHRDIEGEVETTGAVPATTPEGMAVQRTTVVKSESKDSPTLLQTEQHDMERTTATRQSDRTETEPANTKFESTALRQVKEVTEVGHAVVDHEVATNTSNDDVIAQQTPSLPMFAAGNTTANDTTVLQAEGVGERSESDTTVQTPRFESNGDVDGRGDDPVTGPGDNKDKSELFTKEVTTVEDEEPDKWTVGGSGGDDKIGDRGYGGMDDGEDDDHEGESGDKVPSPETVEGAVDRKGAEIKATIAEVQVLDRELLERPETRKLVEMGAQFGTEVTGQFGTPNNPKWASGTVEEGVFMSYHNGGSDGHTSVGPKGAGVPRNVLLIAKAVNDAAEREVFDPMMRAIAFYGAEAHDSKQLCGRALLPEGQGAGNGDERMSAEDARNRYLATGGDAATAQEVYDDVMATAFNPQTSAQNVEYEAWRANPHDPALTRKVLGQELTAAADLLSATTRRGPLGNIEYCAESMCLGLKGRIIQEHMQAHDIDPSTVTSVEQMLGVIESDDVLREGFADAVTGNAKFFSDYLKYSDEAIRLACGKGIDELFPGRTQNAEALVRYGVALHARVSPLEILRQTRVTAGY